MDTIGLFDRYRWLVRNSIESPSFQQNSDLALAYLRVRRSDFSVSESVAESMIQFYIAERNKKNLPKNIEIFRRSTEATTKDSFFIQHREDALAMLEKRRSN